MKGLATLDTGHDFGEGDSLPGASSSTPIASPPGWHITGGFTEPGIKATIPKRTRRWLSKLQMDARTEAVVDAMEDDSTIDEISEMLDVGGPPCSSGPLNVDTVLIFIWNLTLQLRFTMIRDSVKVRTRKLSP